jgi:hypothetical protein
VLCGYLILNNQWFWFFKIVNIKEPPVQVFLRKIRIRELPVPPISVTSKNWWFSSKKYQQLERWFFEFWERFYIKIGFLIIFSPPVLGTRVYTRADNWWVSIADSDDRTTLVLIAFSLLDADHWLAISARFVFFNFVNKWSYDHPQEEWAKFG